MKCNKQELINLASQSSNRFVKEGPLLLYERQDGILFKRQESKNKFASFLALLLNSHALDACLMAASACWSTPLNCSVSACCFCVGMSDCCRFE